MPSGCAHCSEPSACQQCARCKGVVYCNANCQQQHWPQVQRLTSAAAYCSMLLLTAVCGAHCAHILLLTAVCGAHSAYMLLLTAVCGAHCAQVLLLTCYTHSPLMTLTRHL